MAAWWTLEHQSDLAVLQPVDEPDLPQRMLPVERQGDQVGDQLGELGHAAG